MSVTFRSEAGKGSLPPKSNDFRHDEFPADFIAALSLGGDSRTAMDPRTGLNKYLCALMPSPGQIYLASCTASPMSSTSLEVAVDAWSDIVRASSPEHRARRLTALTEQIKARLLAYFGVGPLAQLTLCPSGTDALLTAAMLIAQERPADPLTAVLPAASETGTGVPMAAACRLFDGADLGRSLIERPVASVEIPLREGDGKPRSEAAVNHDFATAASRASGRAIIYLTYGTKTGLIAPVSPPLIDDVIVDACQARVEPETVARFLRRGWPVVVTGSKFFGGPAFSGAVLYPRARLNRNGATPRRSMRTEANELGTALRWSAAITAIDEFAPLVSGIPSLLVSMAAVVEKGIGSIPALHRFDGLVPHGPGWADQPSIFTFGVRDPAEPARLLSVAELRPLHQRLAVMGVLLGQPVGVGLSGGLRIAFGARDLLHSATKGALARAFASIVETVASPCRTVIAR